MLRDRLIVAGRVVAITVVLALAAACGDVNAAFERLSEARQLSADLLVQFTRASNASDRAVMADTDEASVAFAREADQARQAVARGIETLTPILTGLGYADESGILREFKGQFDSYGELDRRILDLAVENTNLKAQRLSFGPAAQAADAFRDAVNTLASSTTPPDSWHAKALAASAMAAVREIQALQAPHIAEADDAAMTRMERDMTASESGARASLTALASLVGPPGRPRIAAATAALNRFMNINAQVLALSRRNTNVRSLALSLQQKPGSSKACEDSLHRLQDALAKRGPHVARFQ
jgi:hypothetical protein